MDSDAALRLLGRFSTWQIINYLCCASGFGIAFAWILMTVVFIAETPDHRCAIPENATLNDSIPLVEKDGEWVYDKCTMYVNRSVDNTTVTCQHGYWYDPESGYDSTIVTDWDLVCDKAWLVELSMSFQSVGKIIGAFFFNRISDLYGRKLVFLGCLWSNVIIASIRSFSPNMIAYTLFVFMGGIVQQGMICASFILAIELFPTDQRSTAGTVIEFFWAFGYMSVSPMAYWLRNWRYLELCTALPFILSIPYYWILSESIPWLVVNNRTEEAESILRKAAKMNNITMPDVIFVRNKGKDNVQKAEDSASTSFSSEVYDCNKPLEDLDDMEDHCNKEKLLVASSDTQSSHSDIIDSQRKVQYTMMDIFRSSSLRCYAMILFCMWFLITMSYSGINLTVTFLPGNPYLNFFLYAVMENPAYLLAWLLAEKCERRLSMMGMNVVAGLTLIASTLISLHSSAASLTPLVVALSMLGKMLVTASFATIYVIVPEVFPTSVRNIGMGMCQSSGRIGTLISPFSRILYRRIEWLPSLITGAALVCSGMIALLLPETRFTQLPDTMEEVAAMSRSSRCLSKVKARSRPSRCKSTDGPYEAGMALATEKI